MKKITISHTTHAGGNTRYARMTKKETELVIETLHEGLLEMLEISNYKPHIRVMMHNDSPVLGKHTAAGKGRYNSMASFISGILKQFRVNANRDIAEKYLEGITLCTELFQQEISNTYPIIEFHDTGKTTPVFGTALDKFVV